MLNFAIYERRPERRVVAGEFTLMGCRGLDCGPVVLEGERRACSAAVRQRSARSAVSTRAPSSPHSTSRLSALFASCRHPNKSQSPIPE